MEEQQKRRGGAYDESLIIFNLTAYQLSRYYEIRGKRGKWAAKDYAITCLNRRIIDIPAKSKPIIEGVNSDPLSSVLHQLVDVIVEDNRFGFLTEEDIDHVISIIKTLSNCRMTYQQAACELGCSVPTLQTKVCRYRVKTEHITYLRRSDVNKLKKRKMK